MSAMNNQYLSWNADPQRVNECAARMGNGNCLFEIVLHKVAGMNEIPFENWN